MLQSLQDIFLSNVTCVSNVMLDANILSLYLLLWRQLEMISDLLFNKFLAGLSNISRFSVRHRLQRFEVEL